MDVTAGLESGTMDPFAIALLVGLAALLLWAWLVGRTDQGRGMEPFGLRSARQITEDREALEAEDLAQMLEAHNARRRRRGETDMTAGAMERRVMEDVSDQLRCRQAYLAERDLDQLLEATNARRRARGLPERTRDDLRREFGPAAGPAAPGPAAQGS